MVREINSIPSNMEDKMFEGPIPGQSLTNSVDNRYKWERPPEMTSLKEAREQMFFALTEPKRLESLQTLMANGISINTIAETLLVQGFRDGKFNPDMVVNLMEPTMIILLSIAEKSGINPVVESDEDDDMFMESEDMFPDDTPLSESNLEGQRYMNNRRKKLLMPKKPLNPMSVGKDIKNQLDNLNVEKLQQSLLQRDKPIGE